MSFPTSCYRLFIEESSASSFLISACTISRYSLIRTRLSFTISSPSWSRRKVGVVSVNETIGKTEYIFEICKTRLRITTFAIQFWLLRLVFTVQSRFFQEVACGCRVFPRFPSFRKFRREFVSPKRNKSDWQSRAPKFSKQYLVECRC